MTLPATFPALQNDRVLRAALGQPVDRVPVWLHRQAGRYLPEFRALRQKHDFFEICRTPELACEVTLQPIDRFPLDAAIIFSDILVVPQALGLQVEMLPSIGPNFPNPLRSPEDLTRLKSSIDVDAELGYVYQAITLTRHRLNGRVPLLGFSGAPFTLMAYCIEGRGSKTLSLAKKWLFVYPEQSHALLQKLTDVIVDYLIGQARAGAQMLEVFDTWAGMLAPEEFSVFCLPYLKQISKRVKSSLGDSAVPMILFAKDAHYALDSLSEAGYDVLSLDWTIEPKKAIQCVQGRVSLQGNIDPCALYADQSVIKSKAKEMVAAFRSARGHIANLGHGCYPDFDPTNVGAYIDAIHECSGSDQ